MQYQFPPIMIALSNLLLSIIVIVLIKIYFDQKHNLKQVKDSLIQCQQELEKTKDNDATPLDGIFEYHITVDPQDNYVKLLEYLKEYEKMRGLKVVFAVSSQKNNQYMLSHFTRKNDDRTAIEGANQIANEMRQFGLKVVRIKVESHGAKGIPMTKKDYQMFHKYLIEKYDNAAGQPYYEFHVKVSANKSNPAYYEQLEHDIRQFRGVAISYNLCSQTRMPLLTVRVYDEGFILAIKYKDHVIDTLKTLGYVFDDKIQQEFSLYDTCSNLDDGWLIR